MQRLSIIRYTVNPEAADENIRLSKAVFDEVRWNKPDRLAYGLFRQGDEFIHVFLNLAEDDSDAVTELPSFKAFQADLLARCTVPPAPVRQSVERIDSYGLPA
ncbi:MAG: hypothetical protein ABW023_00360 [Sphingomonas sp.]